MGTSMNRFLLAAALVSALLFAQAEEAVPNQVSVMDHSLHERASVSLAQPLEPGQGAFAAIQEIVTLLAADPTADWTKVDIEGLRRHLIDMNNVTLLADVAVVPVANGVRYIATGEGAVRSSIRRMVLAHAETMNGISGLFIESGEHSEGAIITVTLADSADMAKLEGLGFFGVMTLGAHH